MRNDERFLVSNLIVLVLVVASSWAASGADGSVRSGIDGGSGSKQRWGRPSALATEVPGPRSPDPRYHDYDEIQGLFDTWQRAYPAIFRRELFGRSGRGEPIWAARISRNPSQRAPEPSLLFHAAQHSNEPSGTGAIVFMMERLLSGYGSDPRMTAYVDSLDLWFVPIVNVDGHRLVFGGHPHWADWRKTARDNDGDGRLTYPVDGVDLNRNWDHRWKEHGAVLPEATDYKGPYPFSEPEAVAIRDFVLREMPVIVMDFHSPGKKTLPNMIFWPWLERETETEGVDAPHFRPITQAMANRTLSEIDTVRVNGDWYAYDTLPKEQCWIYGHTGICALLMEISTQFWWEGAMVDTIAARTGRGSFALLERALSGPGLKGSVADDETGLPLVAEIRVEEAHDPKIGPRSTEGRFGSYWRFLEPETYTVTAAREGYVPVTRQVTVRGAGWSEARFRLRASRR